MQGKEKLIVRILAVVLALSMIIPAILSLV